MYVIIVVLLMLIGTSTFVMSVPIHQNYCSGLIENRLVAVIVFVHDGFNDYLYL
jgi:hypothetical protein